MAKKVSKESSTLAQILKVPIRILSKARDFYMKSMIFCDGQVGFGGGYTATPAMLPKSFSVNSSKSSSNNDEDYRELMRAASTRGLGKKIELDLQQRRKQSPASSTGVNKDVMPRSYSVAIGRIDEDSPCDFGEVINVKAADLYPRSRSHAVPSSRRRPSSSIGVF